MKKIIGIIAIALLFSFAGTQEITAQVNWEIKVTWDDYCDDCPEFTGHDYIVCLKIWNKCTETVAYAVNCQFKPSGIFEATFNVGEICLADDEECFEVSATVKKRCVFGQNIICENAEMDLHSCDEIYGGEIVVHVDLN